VALGRKNWIHIGSEQAGPRVAAIISIVETCRRLNIPVREYLGSVLPAVGLEDAKNYSPTDRAGLHTILKRKTTD
jgi:hypothetical protein